MLLGLNFRVVFDIVIVNYRHYVVKMLVIQRFFHTDLYSPSNGTAYL